MKVNRDAQSHVNLMNSRPRTILLMVLIGRESIGILTCIAEVAIILLSLVNGKRFTPLFSFILGCLIVPQNTRGTLNLEEHVVIA